MERLQALEELSSASIDDRLSAARVLVAECRQEDLPRLVDALHHETVPWIKHALSKAIAKLSGDTQTGVNQVGATSQRDDYELIDEVRDHAFTATTQILTHEIEPILGRARYYAENEMPDYNKSSTKRELDRMKRMLEGIKTLGKVAGAPNLEQFDLRELIDESVASESSRTDVEVQIAKTEPLNVVADRTYVELAFCNGLRNAIEATQAAALDTEPIIVNFAKTVSDYWITVLDRGTGLKLTGVGIFDIGNSTKEGHEGLGLSLSQRAIKSLKGSVRLTPREGGGVRYEIRWPVSVGVTDETASS